MLFKVLPQGGNKESSDVNMVNTYMPFVALSYVNDTVILLQFAEESHADPIFLASAPVKAHQHTLFGGKNNKCSLFTIMCFPFV